MDASGSRNDARFPAAEQFDVCWSNAKDHLAFGLGIHYCLGAPLARLEGKIAFETLLGRLKNIRVAPGKNDFYPYTEFYFARITSIACGV